MKRMCFRWMVALGLPLALFSCSKQASGDADPIRPDLPRSGVSTLRSAIMSRGFDSTDIVDYGDYYLVEGDIAFYQSDSAAYVASAINSAQPIKNGKTSQRHIPDGLVDFYVKQDPNTTNWLVKKVPYYINPALSTPNDYWFDAINDAAQEFNLLPTRIHLYRVTNREDADIIVREDNGSLAESIAATGSAPLNGNPGLFVTINTTYQNNANLPYLQKKRIIAHELGHTLGLAHTNGPGNDIPGTPLTDNNSVMLGDTPSWLWNGFSTWDIEALRILYPHPYKGFLTDIADNFAIPDEGYGPIYWLIGSYNFPGNEVRIELYYAYDRGNYWEYAYRRTIAASIPNNGMLQQGFDYSQDASQDLFAIRIISTSNPNQFVFSNSFRFARD